MSIPLKKTGVRLISAAIGLALAGSGTVALNATPAHAAGTVTASSTTASVKSSCAKAVKSYKAAVKAAKKAQKNATKAYNKAKTVRHYSAKTGKLYKTTTAGKKLMKADQKLYKQSKAKTLRVSTTCTTAAKATKISKVTARVKANTKKLNTATKKLKASYVKYGMTKAQAKAAAKAAAKNASKTVVKKEVKRFGSDTFTVYTYKDGSKKSIHKNKFHGTTVTYIPAPLPPVKYVTVAKNIKVQAGTPAAKTKKIVALIQKAAKDAGVPVPQTEIAYSSKHIAGPYASRIIVSCDGRRNYRDTKGWTFETAIPQAVSCRDALGINLDSTDFS